MSKKRRIHQRKTTPSFDSGIIHEPILLFGARQEHVDPRTGLSLYGPYCHKGQAAPHLKSITVGIIGPGNMISDSQEWLKGCSGMVTNDGKEPFLYPHFPGFSSDTRFQCDFTFGDTWNETIKKKDLELAIKADDYFYRINKVISLYIEALETLSTREPRPDVVMLCLPDDVVKACTSQLQKERKKKKLKPKGKKKHKTRGQLALPGMDSEIDESEDVEDRQYENLRRGLKAEAMRFGIPTQIVWARAIALQDQVNARGIKKSQDIATRAWNFTTALYHKAGGTPWRLSEVEDGSCIVGISFFKEKGEGSRMRTSMAQAFTAAGDGFVLRGNSFEWNERKEGKSPKLDKKSAKSLINDVMEMYKKQKRGSLPSRLVIHKTSRFSQDEIDAFESAAELVPRKDFVAFGNRDIQFYRTGMYPPVRGTYVKFSDDNFLLYTMGYIPYLRTYPGLRVPVPIEILEHHGDSPWNLILTEILGLTKLNWNTSAFGNQFPISLAFSRKVGQVLAEIPHDVIPRAAFKFYM